MSSSQSEDFLTTSLLMAYALGRQQGAKAGEEFTEEEAIAAINAALNAAGGS